MNFKKIIMMLLCMVIANGIAFSQKIFEITETSQPNDVFSSDGNEAAILVRCSQSIPLTFSSTMDKSAEPFRVDEQGLDNIYYISFPTGSRYRGRVLIISAAGFTDATILLELEPKQLRTFVLSDPDATVGKGCYLEHRNLAREEIKNSNYNQAREIFIEARTCSDVDTDENEVNISRVDSMIYHRNAGDKAFALLDYREASSHYTKVMSYNPYDTYAEDRNNTCVSNFLSECDVIFDKAEYYYNQKILDKAKQLYEQVVTLGCTNKAIASARINSIESALTSKRDHSHVLTYQYNKDTPIGLSTGKYNKHKVGGYFSFDLNSAIFDAMRNDCTYQDEKYPELNLSFGWTIKLFDYAWIFFGPGGTMKMYYGEYQDDNYPKYQDDKLVEDESDDKYTKKNFAFAVSPEIGICAKYSYFALRISYQYRWSIKSELDKFIKANRVSIGVGVAF